MSVKLGIALLVVFLFTCNCSEKSQAEKSEKQEDIGADLEEPSEKDDDGFVENYDDETARDTTAKETG